MEERQGWFWLHQWQQGKGPDMLTIARVRAILAAAGLEIHQLDQEGRPLRNGLVVLPKRGSRTWLQVYWDGRSQPLLSGLEQHALRDQVEAALTRQPDLVVERYPMGVLVRERRTDAPVRTPLREMESLPSAHPMIEAAGLAWTVCAGGYQTLAFWSSKEAAIQIAQHVTDQLGVPVVHKEDDTMSRAYRLFTTWNPRITPGPR